MIIPSPYYRLAAPPRTSPFSLSDDRSDGDIREDQNYQVSVQSFGVNHNGQLQ